MNVVAITNKTSYNFISIYQLLKCDIENVIRLYISDSFLDRIPDELIKSFDKFVNLKCIEFSNNLISNYNVLSKLPKLEELNISRYLTTIERYEYCQGFNGFKCNCNINKLVIPNLKKLRVGCAVCTKMPDMLELENLETLEICSNKIDINKLNYLPNTLKYLVITANIFINNTMLNLPISIEKITFKGYMNNSFDVNNLNIIKNFRYPYGTKVVYTKLERNKYKTIESEINLI